MPLDTVKLASLKALANPTAGEILAVYWGGAVGTKYYSFTRLHEQSNFSGLSLTPVEARFNSFQEFDLSADISDEVITFDFENIDQDIATKFYATGAGVKCELFYWFPQVDWLTSIWWGILQPPSEADYERFRADASAGFMSQMKMMPRRGLYPKNCPFTFGGTLATSAEVAANDCKYDRHVGGTQGLLNGATPFTFCDKLKASCIARWGDALSFGAFDTSAQSIVSDIPNGVIAASRGNQSNLKRPLRAVIGTKCIRDLDLLAWRREPNPNTPDNGWVSGLWAISEGPVNRLWAFNVNGVWADTTIHFMGYRWGTNRQPATLYAPGISNFSHTAQVATRWGWVNANNTDVTQAKTFVAMEGLSNIRVYTNSSTYTETYTNNRVWGLLRCYTDKRWGRGYAHSRFDIDSWIDAATWSDETVRFTYTHPDATTTNYDHRRTQLDVDLQGRIAQQQITDICRAGRIGIPFQYEGKYKIVPLRKEADLSAVPVFRDTGEDRNILRDERGKPFLSYSQISPAKLPNKVVLTYEHGDTDVAGLEYDIERPLTFEDEDAQKAAGEALGDGSTEVVEKRYSAFGIRSYNQAVKLGWSLLDLGEFDSGGLRNNLEIKFRTWFVNAIELHKYKVIKVESALLSQHFDFQYFRIKKMRRRKDLTVDIIAQAYPEDYYATFETVLDATPEIDPSLSFTIKRTARPSFDSVTYAAGVLTVEVS